MIAFNAPKDYPEMLNKIGISTFVVALILAGVVAQANAKVGALLSWGALKIPVFSVNLPPLFVGLCGLIAVIFRAVKLHDRISDLFRIREDFDLHEILTPLAGGVGLATPLPRLQGFRRIRDHLMNTVFYRYAGSSSPKISQHYITMALDTWTWFWILTEMEVLALFAVLLLLFSRAFVHAAAVLGAMWLCLLAMGVLRRSCAHHAHIEVEQILEDESRHREIRAAFDAVPSSPV
jgi:hypothetical protein